MSKLMDFVFSYVIKLNFLNGMRSYIAGSGMIMTGLGLVANQIGGTVYDHDTMEKGIALVLAGLAVIGHAGKMEKLTDIAKNNASKVSP